MQLSGEFKVKTYVNVLVLENYQYTFLTLSQAFLGKICLLADDVHTNLDNFLLWIKYVQITAGCESPNLQF